MPRYGKIYKPFDKTVPSLELDITELCKINGKISPYVIVSYLDSFYQTKNCVTCVEARRVWYAAKNVKMIFAIHVIQNGTIIQIDQLIITKI